MENVLWERDCYAWREGEIVVLLGMVLRNFMLECVGRFEVDTIRE